MNNTPKDGGPAFPVFPETSVGHSAAFRGLSLRDYFAGQALAGLLGISPQENVYLGNPMERSLNVWVASAAYKYADAMLKAREGQDDEQA